MRHRRCTETDFGAYQLQIELLRGLFPDGEDHTPRLKTESDQSWALKEVATSYSACGQSGRAVSLLCMAITIGENSGDKQGVAISLRCLVDDQLKLGELSKGSESLRKYTGLARNIRDKREEAVGCLELGLLEAYQARFAESLSELDAALSSFREQSEKQAEGIVWAYRAIRALLKKNPLEALDAARRSRELADAERVEVDSIQAEWLLGWCLITQSPADAEAHLTEALTRCRRINLVYFEPNILLAFARLHVARNDHAAALTDAREALAIADRCEYRLVQADCHNLLAQLSLAANDRTTALKHAKIARERA